MSGLDTHTHTHTHTQYDYRNPRCACAARVNKGSDLLKNFSQLMLKQKLLHVPFCILTYLCGCHLERSKHTAYSTQHTNDVLTYYSCPSPNPNPVYTHSVYTASDSDSHTNNTDISSSDSFSVFSDLVYTSPCVNDTILERGGLSHTRVVEWLRTKP